MQLIDAQLCWGDEGKEAFSCRETYSLSDYGKCDCYHTDLISSISYIYNVLELYFALPQIPFYFSDYSSYRNDQNNMYGNVEIEPLDDENQAYSNQKLSEVDKCNLPMNVSVINQITR